MTNSEQHIIDLIAEVRKEIGEIKDELSGFKKIIFGDEKGSLGILQKNDFMWRLHVVWPWCSLTAAISVIGTLLVQKIFN